MLSQKKILVTKNFSHKFFSHNKNLVTKKIYLQKEFSHKKFKSQILVTKIFQSQSKF
jgi:hypothetical protein